MIGGGGGKGCFLNGLLSWVFVFLPALKPTLHSAIQQQWGIFFYNYLQQGSYPNKSNSLYNGEIDTVWTVVEEINQNPAIKLSIHFKPCWIKLLKWIIFHAKLLSLLLSFFTFLIMLINFFEMTFALTFVFIFVTIAMLACSKCSLCWESSFQ